jgi:8-oxo-dGTP diphosphatase
MKVGQKAIIMKDDKYLILHKSLTVPRFPGYWDFPGGGLEENESPLEGIKREILEETSLVMEPIEVIWRCQLMVNQIETQYWIYSVKFVSGDVVLSHEHTEFKWVTKKELLKLKVQPYIEKYFEENL